MEMECTSQQEAMILQEEGKVQQQGLEAVRLLLQKHSADPDNAVISKLLCSSAATAALVHDNCASQMTVHLYHPDERLAREQLCTWLAKHARLLKHLHLVFSRYVMSCDVEEFAAAGLRAAAGMANTPAAVAPTHMGHNPAQALVQAYHTAQQGISLMQQSVSPQSAEQGSGSMLPLLELQLRGIMYGTLLPTISACCGHLTRLQLQINTSSLPMDVRTRDFSCLGALRDLRELVVSSDGHFWVQEDSLSCLSSLTQLTQLELAGLGHSLATHLPLSIVNLAIADTDSVPDLRRLSNLTRLQAYDLQEPQVLPAQLRELCLESGYLEWSEEFLQLQQLQSLQLNMDPGEIPCLAPLTAWTHLTALKVSTHMISPYSNELSALCGQLPSLPLVQLQSNNDRFKAADIQELGRCTQLTALYFIDGHLGLSVDGFAKQLQKLQGLECLDLGGSRFSPHPQLPADLQPVVDAITQLCGKRLREVTLTSVVLSGEQQSVLQGLLGSGFRYLEGQLPAVTPESSAAYSDSMGLYSGELSTNDSGWIGDDGPVSDADDGDWD